MSLAITSGSMGSCRKVMRLMWSRMKQTKTIDIDDTQTDLKRCLTRGRLTFIGLANTVGVGIYVLIGVATKDYAGPSVVLSFIVAAIVTMLNAFCFAEYASRAPKTGAYYTFLYQTVGEAVAFCVGWIGIISAAASFSVSCRGLSGYLDALFHHAIQNFTVNHIANWTSHGQPFPEYPDFTAIAAVLVVMVITSVGVNFSSFFSSVLAGISCLLLVFITVIGFFYADFNNWFNTNGGFFPYGFSGVLKASSACFYAFAGFDIIAMSSEEAVNPVKTVPQSIALTLLLVTILYLGVSISFTLMVPYDMVNKSAPFPGAFQYHNVMWAKYLIAVGTVLTLSNLCALSLFGVQRLVYSMSTDGLLFKCFSKVNEKTKVPVRPVLALGPIVIVFVLSIDLSNLISFMVIYGFIQSSFFAAYMIVLRYEPIETYHELTADGAIPNTATSNDLNESQDQPDDETDTLVEHLRDNSVFNDMQAENNSTVPRKLYSRYDHLTNSCSVRQCVLILSIACFLLALQFVKGSEDIASGSPLALCSVNVLVIIISIMSWMIWNREQKGENKGYLVPLMPFLPVTTLFVNMLMLVSIAERALIIAALILPAIGMIVYLVVVAYGAVKSGRSDCQDEAGLLRGQAAGDSDVDVIEF